MYAATRSGSWIGTTETQAINGGSLPVIDPSYGEILSYAACRDTVDID